MGSKTILRSPRSVAPGVLFPSLCFVPSQCLTFGLHGIAWGYCCASSSLGFISGFKLDPGLLRRFLFISSFIRAGINVGGG
jgi:hypothetical protein